MNQRTNQRTSITIDHSGGVALPTGDTPRTHLGALSSAPHRTSAFDLIAAQPWAITNDALTTISAIARRENAAPEAVEAKLGRPLQNARQVTMRGSVAVVPVTGPIFRYANLFTEISGATSLEVLARDFTTALEDPSVSAIVLNIDSPGGQASGIAEFAQMVHASAKPVTAYIDGTAASAAYWIASAAGRMVISSTGMVGSIGAVVAIDTSNKASGVVEIVSAQSPKKRADVSTADGRAQIQSIIDQLAQVFIDNVAAFRGVSVDTVLADFGQGDMRLGAAAVALGMADQVSTLEQVLAELNTPKNSPVKGSTMNREQLQAEHPALVAALLTEGAAAERTRINDVRAQSLPGHEALIAQFEADGTTTGPMAAVAVLNAERAVAAGRHGQLVADAPAAVAHTSAPKDVIDADAGLSAEEKVKAKWDRSPALRAEFGDNFASYAALEKADAEGKVRILSGTRK